MPPLSLDGARSRLKAKIKRAQRALSGTPSASVDSPSPSPSLSPAAMPSTTPSPPSTPPSFASQLSTSIRPSHHTLNELITSRLPLALPPQTSSPLSYAKGLTVFGHLYTAIESALEDHPPPSDARLAQSLSLLRSTPGLFRRPRLRADLATLRTSLAAPQAASLSALHHSTHHYHTALLTTLTSHPHLLLAWSWNMYLALFNGGRIIRAALHRAPHTFWLPSSPSLDPLPLTFWDFDGQDENQDTKLTFQRNFDAAAALLTPQERQDVICEAKRVYAVCQDMVAVLDRETQNPTQQTTPTPPPQAAPRAPKTPTTFNPFIVGAVALLTALVLTGWSWTRTWTATFPPGLTR